MTQSIIVSIPRPEKSLNSIIEQPHTVFNPVPLLVDILKNMKLTSIAYKLVESILPPVLYLPPHKVLPLSLTLLDPVILLRSYNTLAVHRQIRIQSDKSVGLKAEVVSK